MAQADMPRVAVLGAGPIGLEAALHAAHAGYRVTVYERGDVADHVGQWGHVRLFTPFGQNTTPLGLEAIRKEHPQHQLAGPNDHLTGRDFRDQYLIPLTLTSHLADAVQTRTQVLAIGRAGSLKGEAKRDGPFRLLLRDDKGNERFAEADVVLDCTGTYGHHRWAGDGGIPALGEAVAERAIAYGLDDILGQRKAHYAGKSTIVIGGGYSAATSVSLLAQVADENSATWAIWLTRGPRSAPLPRNPNDPLRERDRLAARANNLATRGDGNVEYHPQTLIDEIVSHGPDKGFRVSGRVNGKAMTWEVDRVIANVGFRADEALTREVEPTAEAGYFVLGAKAAGRDSSFLLAKGFEQIKDVMATLAKKWPRG